MLASISFGVWKAVLGVEDDHDRSWSDGLPAAVSHALQNGLEVRITRDWQHVTVVQVYQADGAWYVYSYAEAVARGSGE